MPDAITLFRSGRIWRGGYRAVRIPAIAAVDARRIVVVAVGRRFVTDFGPSDLVIRRSDDGGATWTPRRVLVRGWGRTIDNPTLVADPASGALHLFSQSRYRRLWQRTSTDGGATWSRRIDRTAVVRAASTPEFEVRQLAPGPGAGAALVGGRLVLPLWAASGRRHKPSATLTIVSDDGGITWQPGELVAGPGGRYPNPSEASVAPLPGGGAILTFRQRRVRTRVFTWSPDGATQWSTPQPAADLFEPVCHAALAAVGDGNVLVFANPDSRDTSTPQLIDGKSPRENLRVRWSRDAGRTWDAGVVVDPGAAGYAALAAAAGSGARSVSDAGSDAGSDAVHVVWEHGRLAGTALWPTEIRFRTVAGARDDGLADGVAEGLADVGGPAHT